MHHIYEKIDRWLLPVLVLLLILQLVLLPWSVGIAWADQSAKPYNRLIYSRPGRLKWDSSVGILPDGSAELKLFSSQYGAVASGNQDKVIAPGTGQSSTLRLRSEVYPEIDFTAILYEIKTDDRIPVTAVLADHPNFEEAERYRLPEGVKEEQVLQVVSGHIREFGSQDFHVSWEWDFEEDNGQDLVDTILGNQEPLGEVTVGLYIVVEDDNHYSLPKTGDEAPIGLYLTVMTVSFVLLVLLVWERRREKASEDDQIIM